MCAIECYGVAIGISDGVLIAELAMSSLVAVFAVEAIISYTEEKH